MTDYAGNALPPDADFFVAPPVELGDVWRAFSTLKRSESPKSTGARLGLAVGSCVASFVALMLLGIAIISMCSLDADWLGWLIAGSVAVAFFLAATIWCNARFQHTCSYVSAKGMARYRCHGSRGTITASECFLFRPDANCHGVLTTNTQDGAYAGSGYRFAWLDPQGRVLHAIEGRHGSESNTPPMDNDFWYGSAAYEAGMHFERVQLALELLQQSEPDPSQPS